MLAQSRHDESLNSLTDDLLKRGIASTKLDAQKLAANMLGKVEQPSFSKPHAQQMRQEPRIVERIIETPKPNPEIEAKLAQTQNQIDRQEEVIQTLREELAAVREQHSHLHSKYAELHEKVEKHMMQESPDTMYDESVQTHELSPQANDIQQEYEAEEEDKQVQNEIKDEILEVEHTTQMADDTPLIPSSDVSTEEKKEDVDLTNLFSNS